LAALVALARPSTASPNADPPAPIREAGLLLTGGETPPPDDAPWQKQSLPDDWSRTRPQMGGDAWYRLDFDVPRDRLQLSAVYVPRLSMVGVPFVNGVQIGTTRHFGEPMTRLWYRPQLHWIPAALLKPGRNVLHVRIRAYPDNQGGLSEVYVGTPEPLVRLWESHVLRQVTAMQITTGITAALSLLVLVAWAVLRWNSAYGYFGVATLCWTLHSTLVLAVEIPIPTLQWEVLIVASLVWMIVAMMMFALRFAGLHRPWIERAALVFAVAAPGLLWLAGITQIFAVANACLLLLICIGVYEFKILFDVARRSRSVESILLVAAGVWVLWLGAHDWLNRQGTWAYAEPFNMHYGLPVLFIAVFWNLLGQVAVARRASENLNRELEARVKEKADALERSHERLRSAHAARALAAERERIMRDMHDGVGSQLIATRQLAERGMLGSQELTAMLDECIDDLRLMIDSLEPADGDLLTVLGNLRYRLTDRLARQGLTLHWNVSELPRTPGLAPRDILQILRIVQEAFANVIKHSGASEVSFSAALAPDDRHIVLCVRDNGRGVDAALAGHGRGLRNMAQRAAAVGGMLRVDGDHGGCVMTLWLPLPSRDADNLDIDPDAASERMSA
jgi:signal transduction histidine kinase